MNLARGTHASTAHVLSLGRGPPCRLDVIEQPQFFALHVREPVHALGHPQHAAAYVLLMGGHEQHSLNAVPVWHVPDSPTAPHPEPQGR